VSTLGPEEWRDLYGDPPKRGKKRRVSLRARALNARATLDVLLRDARQDQGRAVRSLLGDAERCTDLARILDDAATIATAASTVVRGHVELAAHLESALTSMQAAAKLLASPKTSQIDAETWRHIEENACGVASLAARVVDRLSPPTRGHCRERKVRKALGYTYP